MKDALDVLIAYRQPELDRLLRRIDRADTQAGAIITGGAALAGIAAAALAALHRRLDAVPIVLASIGGVCIALAAIISLLGRDPRFRSGGEVFGPTWLIPGFASHALQVFRRSPDREALKQFVGSRQRYLTNAGEACAVPEDASFRFARALRRRVYDELRGVLAERQVTLSRADRNTTSVEIRQSVADSLALRISMLDQVALWREQVTRRASLLLAGGLWLVGAAFFMTLI